MKPSERILKTQSLTQNYLLTAELLGLSYDEVRYVCEHEEVEIKEMPCVFCNKLSEHEAWQMKCNNQHSGNFGKLIWVYSCVKCNGLRSEKFRVKL